MCLPSLDGIWFETLYIVVEICVWMIYSIYSESKTETTLSGGIQLEQRIPQGKLAHFVTTSYFLLAFFACSVNF
jgi:hypothetical protein